MKKLSIQIVGIGPGNEDLITFEVQNAISNATDIIGYFPYIQRIKPREDLTLHASDNRVELERAKHAFSLALEGKQVVIVSSGDPGVFAMAAAVFEALENGPQEWKSVDVQVLPGITAMLAASARMGAPLGHDFCAINLSDNLKAFSILEKRVRMAVRGDFAMAFYNPRSKSRPDTFGKIIEIIRSEAQSDLLFMFARNVTRTDETYVLTPLSQVQPEQADMRTVVIIGNSKTRKIDGTKFVYTPRHSR